MDARRPPGFVGSGGYVHWLGTDAQGRDLLSAILYGLRISIQIGVAAGAIALVARRDARHDARPISAAASKRFIMRIVDLAALVPGDPAGARALARCSARA